MAPTPAEGALLAEPFTLVVHAEDASGIVKMALLQPDLFAQNATVTLDPATLRVELDPSLLPSGEQGFVVQAEDAWGNTAQAVRTLTLDATPPVVSIELPAVFSDPQQPITVTVADDSDILAVTVTLNGDEQPLPLALADGVWRGFPSWVEGQNTVTVTATDGAGTQSSVTRAATLDSTAPTLALEKPTPGSYVLPTPLPLQIAVTDATPIASVKIGVGQAEEAATELGGLWQATVDPGSADGPIGLVLEATDMVGNVGKAAANLIVDGTAPTLGEPTLSDTVKTDGVYWTAAPELELSVTAQDGGAGVAAVCVNKACGTATGGQTWQVTLQTPSNGVSAMSLVATDGVGNATTAPLAIGQDLTPPTCALDVPPTGLWFAEPTVALTGTTADSGAQGITVTIKANGQLAAASLTGQAFSGAITLPPGASTVVVTCQDAVGNQASTAATVHVDLEPPALSLNPTTFRSEQGAPVSLDGDQASYDLSGQPQITVSAESCPEGEACTPAWPKYASHLRHVPGQPVKISNLASFAFAPTDDAVAADQIALSYTFDGPGGPLIAPREVPIIQEMRRVPVAIGFFTDQDPEAFTWSPEAVPTAITVTATDLAGNTSTHTWSFELDLLAPPVFIRPLTGANITGWDAAFFSLDGSYQAGDPLNAKDIAMPFMPSPVGLVAKNGGLRIARFEVENPYALDLMVQPGAVPVWVHELTGRAYLVGTSSPCLGAYCAMGTCTLAFAGDADASCQSPPESSFWATRAATEVAKVIPFAMSQKNVPEPSPLPSPPLSAMVELPAKQSIIFDLVLQSAGACLIGAPDTYGDGPNAVRVHIAGKACQTYGPESSHNDTARCTESATSMPPLYGCKVAQYAAPRVTRGLRLDSDGPGAESTATLWVQHRLPGFSAAELTTNSAAYALEFEYQTLATDLPTQP